MALRDFTDDDGVHWQVWRVTPTTERNGVSLAGVALSHEASQGWLAFQSQGERRRFFAPPLQWDALPDVELRRLCTHAVRVPTPRG